MALSQDRIIFVFWCQKNNTYSKDVLDWYAI